MRQGSKKVVQRPRLPESRTEDHRGAEATTTLPCGRTQATMAAVSCGASTGLHLIADFTEESLAAPTRIFGIVDVDVVVLAARLVVRLQGPPGMGQKCEGRWNLICVKAHGSDN